jgi:hypothetical protein
MNYSELKTLMDFVSVTRQLACPPKSCSSCRFRSRDSISWSSFSLSCCIMIRKKSIRSFSFPPIENLMFLQFFFIKKNKIWHWIAIASSVIVETFASSGLLRSSYFDSWSTHVTRFMLSSVMLCDSYLVTLPCSHGKVKYIKFPWFEFHCRRYVSSFRPVRSGLNRFHCSKSS